MAEIVNIKGNGHDVYDSAGNWINWVEDSQDNTIISGTDDDDAVRNEGVNVRIYTGKGNDNIANENSTVTVYAGEGSDTIYNSGDNVRLYGEEDADSIKNDGGYYVTIRGGGGNNTLESYEGENVEIYGGDADDYISAEGEEITIYSAAGNDFIYTDSNNAVINAGNGADSVQNIGNDTRIVLGNGADIVLNQGDNVTIEGNAGDKHITNRGLSGDSSYATSNVYILTGAGNDFIESYGDDVTINTGDGQDEIFLTRGHYNVIDAGADNDIIKLDGYGNTVIGGTGNDSVSIKNYGGSKNTYTFQYSAGDGHDTLSTDARIYLADAQIDEVSVSGNDMVYKIGDGSITIKDGANSDTDFFIDAINPVDTTPKEDLETVPADTTLTEEFETVPVGTVVSMNGKYYEVTESGFKLFEGIETTENSTGETTTNLQPKSVLYEDGQYYVVNEDHSLSTIPGNEVNNYINININSTVSVVNSTTIINNNTAISLINNSYIYDGGNKTINNYIAGEQINLTSDYQGIDVQGDSFIVKSSSGNLEIQNARDKFINYGDATSNLVAYSYLGRAGGIIEGRDKAQAEIMIGGDHVNNQIFAGNGGSSLWGGNGGADTLVGGSGYDEFFFAIGSGGDVVQNADSNDMINLLGISLSQISEVFVSREQVHINFTSGEFLQVKGNTGVGYKVQETTYFCNQETGEWFTK